MKNVHSSDVLLISAKTEDGFDRLEERMRQYLDPADPKWIYVVGRTNVGKSMFVTRWSRQGMTNEPASRHQATIWQQLPVSLTCIHIMKMNCMSTVHYENEL